jgi:hypothetical protein
MGKDVEPGTSIFKFKEELAKELFPADEKRGGPTQPSKQAPAPARRGGVYRTTIGGKSITVEPE